MKIPQLAGTLLIALTTVTLFANCTSGTNKKGGTTKSALSASGDSSEVAVTDTTRKPIDTAKYNTLMLKLAHGDTTGRWPVKPQPYPLPGAILPYKRIIAYYGNIYSKRMGALGEYAPKEMLSRLDAEVKNGKKQTHLHQYNLLYIISPLSHRVMVVKMASTDSECLINKLIPYWLFQGCVKT